MKYYHVRWNETVSREFVVKATDNDNAENAIQEFLASGEKPTAFVRPLRTDTSSGLDTMETDIAGWNDAGKKNKRSK